MTFPLKVIGILKSKVPEEKILVTMTPTAGFTVGFNLTFTGSIDIDFKDGGGKEALTSGVEKTHLYASAATYIAEISGDLANITQFTADNNRITTITDLKTGVCVFDLSSNLISGVLDMTNAPITDNFIITNNTGLTGVTHAASGNIITQVYRIDNTGITGVHSLANTPIEGQLFASGCPNITGFTFASSGNGILTDTRLFNSGFTTIDLSGINISTKLWVNSNSGATTLLLASSGNGLLNDVRLFSSGYTSLDFSNTPCGGSWWANSCTALTTINFSNPGNTALTNWLFNNCNQTNFDFSVFPTSNGINVDLRTNSFTSTEHDNQLINLDAQGWVNGTLQITSGNTARTSASDTAYNNLITNGWTIT
jgi:hypothetical protein